MRAVIGIGGKHTIARAGETAREEAAETRAALEERLASLPENSRERVEVDTAEWAVDVVE